LENQYQEASLGQRFLNFVIDNLLMRYGLSTITGYLVLSLIETMDPEMIWKLVEGTSQWVFFLVSYLIGVFNYITYYTFCEKLFKGYTLGKLITGSRAIREDGTELTFRDAILRSLVRIIPFEVFSAFGVRPWHDQWTKTVVIKSS